MNRVFIGVDSRQPIGYNVLQWSIHASAKRPISVQPLMLDQMPEGTPRGLTEFTYSRYLIPYLCNFAGRALFMDADMVVTHGNDLNELFDLLEGVEFDVAMNTDQPSFEWPSMMLFNCASFKHLKPGTIGSHTTKEIVEEARVASFPPEWNHMVTVADKKSASDGAKVIHFTQGLPCFFETRNTTGAGHWEAMKRHMLHSVSWKALMGQSVHARPVLENLISNYMKP